MKLLQLVNVVQCMETASMGHVSAPLDGLDYSVKVEREVFSFCDLILCLIVPMSVPLRSSSFCATYTGLQYDTSGGIQCVGNCELSTFYDRTCLSSTSFL